MKNITALVISTILLVPTISTVRASALSLSNTSISSPLGNKQGAITDLSKAADLFRQQGRMEDYKRAMGIIAEMK